jgi:hypothetical protein
MLKLVVHKVSLRLYEVNNTQELCLVKLLEIVVIVQDLHTVVAQMVFFGHCIVCSDVSGITLSSSSG